MTPTRLRDAIASLGWTQRGLARMLDFDERMVRRWAAGSGAIPPEVATWLDRLAAAAEANPAPTAWRLRPLEPRVGAT